MAFLNDLLKVAGTVGQFVPGGQLIGAGAGALGGILDASDARKKQRKQQEAIAKQGTQTGALGQDYLALEQKLMPELVKSAVGEYQNYNASDYIDPQYRGILEGNGAQADNAINALFQDFASRGLLRPSSGLSAGVANIRGQSQAASTRALSDLIVQAQQLKQQRLQTALGAVGGVGQRGTAMQNQSLGTMGGLEGMYASEADSIGQALSGLGQLAGQAAKRPKKAGQATLNTNNSATPVNPSLGALNVQPIAGPSVDPVSTIAPKKVRRTNVSGGM